MSAARTAILRALRAAGPVARAAVEPLDERALFRDFPDSKQAVRETFYAQLGALSGELLEAPDAAIAARHLCQVLGEGGQRCAAQSFPLLARLRDASPELERVLADSAEFPDDPVALSRYDVGVTAADALVARTGSIFVRSASAGGRQLSVLPPVHVVVAHTSQLVPSVGDALAMLADDDGCSFATLISGPSRTADIEKILVLGAHGPKRLVVVLLDD